MRQAARKVALENSRLRSLLASRGVTQEEVDHYLASSERRAAAASAGGLPTTALAPQTGEAGPPPPVSDMDLGSSRPDCGVPNRASSTSALDTLAIAADASVRQICCGPMTQCSPADAPLADVPGQPSDSCFPGRGPASPSPSPDLNHPNTTASPLEMPCTAAAHIMVGISRDENMELAREALGCSGPEECLVKNTLVFQLLDSAETDR